MGRKIVLTGTTLTDLDAPRLATVFARDTFTATDGTLVTARTSDSGHNWVQHPAASGQFAIHSNRAYCTTAGVVYMDVTPPSSRYTVTAEYRVISTTGSASIIGYADPTAATFYFVRYGASAWELFKSVAGTVTMLDSQEATVTANTTYAVRLVLEAGVQQVYVDDVLVCAATDTAITGPGRIGLRESAPGATVSGKHIDTITVIG